jgi:drug/metabolite transporter (DMT)-like permease
MSRGVQAGAAAGTAAPITWWWLAIALAAQTAWGIYPAVGRYMQTVSDLPSMSVLVLGGIPMTLLLFFYVLPRYGLRLYRGGTIWLFGLVVVLRSITNLLSQRFTLAIYVQLIGLLTPFLVVLLARLVLRERTPRYTGMALTFSLIGALLMLSENIGAQGISLAVGPSDWLGIGLALASSSFLALYMILVRRIAQRPGGATRVPPAALLAFQTVLIQITAVSISLLIGEDWSRWTEIGPTDWLVFLSYVFFVIIGANGLQISALQHVGASLMSSLMGWRLVCAFVAGIVLLGEQLTSIWQLLGMALVLVTVTLYLWQQGSQTN